MAYHKALLYSATDSKISELRTLDMYLMGLSDEQEKKYKLLQERCEKSAVSSYTADDSEYHFKFRQISSAPYVISSQGNSELLHKPIIAIVGPRKATPYARQVLEELFMKLQHYDVVTISGLADGVDMMAHELSLQYNIPTIAVLGGGLQYYLKSKSREIIQKIAQSGGLIISEFKLDKGPEKYTFPQRNRIVAGLSDMVFLPEAGLKSGSLITVDFARSMHKDVYGTPNTIFSATSAGLHHSMQEGIIKPVIEMERMLDKYFGKKISNGKLILTHGPEPEIYGGINKVIQELQKNPAGLSMDELVGQTGLSTQDVMSQLSLGEVMGSIRKDGGVWRIV